MKAIITPKFQIDVTDWYEDEKLTELEKVEKLKEDLSDFSVFMLHCDYVAFKDIDIEITDTKVF